jgi:hypothetical protein
MTSYRVGEEVVYRGDRYVVAEASDDAPYRYRLLATTHAGAQFVWANEAELAKIVGYTAPRDDTTIY